MGFGISAFVDEMPEVLGICESFVLGREFGAIEKVSEGAFVEDAVDDHFIFGHFEVEPPVVGAEAVESFVIALNFTELFAIKVFQVLVGDLKLIEDLKLG